MGYEKLQEMTGMYIDLLHFQHIPLSTSSLSVFQEEVLDFGHFETFQHHWYHTLYSKPVSVVRINDGLLSEIQLLLLWHPIFS